MTTKTYGQYCSIARALDVVGERWSLLIVRELLEGPRRYVDLQAGLVHVSTDMLAARLKDLERAGVVTRRVLPPPAGSKVYELTARGRDLEPVLNELARWGVQDLGPRKGLEFHLSWLERAVRALIGPDRDGVDLTVRFELPEGTFALRIDERTVEAVDPDAKADVVVTGKVEDLATIAADPDRGAQLIASGRVAVAGRATALTRYAALFARTGAASPK